MGESWPPRRTCSNGRRWETPRLRWLRRHYTNAVAVTATLLKAETVLDATPDRRTNSNDGSWRSCGVLAVLRASLKERYVRGQCLAGRDLARAITCQSRKSPVVSPPPRECITVLITLLIVLHSKLWFT
ncbi:hypothetical protein PC113_g21504 [Phytophthora cactorum]|uniref:Uncharacterized protein n=1 Tax=Phytophthora cactorum TaxID=29920 RepID=A0A8T0Y0G1_9STRA|nr:hypothetical protein PC113_g21504 [Phytophthora cactorum]KAG3126414.1 hypothetical protein C6341_g25376 [Phytophthora cactorum]